MKLAIADPPYLGRGRKIYGDAPVKSFHLRTTLATGRAASRADNHPDADVWDKPETHAELVERLRSEYDGWAIALAVDNLPHYLQWVPAGTRTCVWHKTNAVPSRSRITTAWEPVLVWPPVARRLNRVGDVREDVIKCPSGGGFVGAKHPAWTRWVLDMLGYDPDEDTVDDLFGGSGAVAAEIAQGVLL